MTPITLRDDILNVLLRAYAPKEFHDKPWYTVQAKSVRATGVSAQMCLQLTTDILALYAYTHIDPEHDHRARYYGETLGNEIRHIIWMSFSGGSTATRVAEKICEILKVKGPEA